MVESFRIYFIFLYILSFVFLLYFDITSDSKVSAQQGAEPKPQVEGLPTDAAMTAPDATNATFFNPKEFINFTKAFIGNPEYNVMYVPFITEANLTTTCFKTVPDVVKMTIELITIDCDDIFIFSKSDSQQINSTIYSENYNNELRAIKMNPDQKVKFLPQIIKNIYKPVDFYCLEWGQKPKLKFGLDPYNCDKFSILFSPKPQ
jgi:hypothetical protein